MIARDSSALLWSIYFECNATAPFMLTLMCLCSLSWTSASRLGAGDWRHSLFVFLNLSMIFWSAGRSCLYLIQHGYPLQFHARSTTMSLICGRTRPHRCCTYHQRPSTRCSHFLQSSWITLLLFCMYLFTGFKRLLTSCAA